MDIAADLDFVLSVSADHLQAAVAPWQDHLMTDTGPLDASGGEPVDESELSALVEVAKARQRNIYALRGEIISELNGIEGWLDVGISAYFFQRASGAPRYPQFGTLILCRLRMTDKIDIIGVILTELSMKDSFSSAVTRLRKANDVRNRQAHSYVMWNAQPEVLTSGNWHEILKPHAQSVTRREGWNLSPVDEEELAG